LQDAFLLLWWQATEALQALSQNLLPSWRKAAKQGIVVQRFLLLIGRQIFVAAQPLAGMIALRLGLPPGFLPRLAPCRQPILGATRRRHGRQH
jgi:hypothetical protein